MFKFHIGFVIPEPQSSSEFCIIAYDEESDYFRIFRNAILNGPLEKPEGWEEYES